MRPLTFDDIFSPRSPIAYTFSGTETKTINLKTAVANLDFRDSNSPLDLKFQTSLRLTASSTARLEFNFTLYKVPQGATSPTEVTTFKLSKSFTEEKLSSSEARKFNYPLCEESIEVPTEYYLELTSISSHGEGSFDLNLKGTILGMTAS